LAALKKLLLSQWKYKAEVAKTKKSEANRSKTIAKAMKAKGYTIDEMVELTGLTKKAIQSIRK